MAGPIEQSTSRKSCLWAARQGPYTFVIAKEWSETLDWKKEVKENLLAKNLGQSNRSAFQAVTKPPKASIEGTKLKDPMEGGRNELALNEVIRCSFDS